MSAQVLDRGQVKAAPLTEQQYQEVSKVDTPLRTRDDLLMMSEYYAKPDLIEIDEDVIQYLDYSSALSRHAGLAGLPESWDLFEQTRFILVYSAQLYKLWDIDDIGRLHKVFHGTLSGSLAIRDLLLSRWVTRGATPVECPVTIFYTVNDRVRRTRILQCLNDSEYDLNQVAGDLLDKALSDGLSVADADHLARVFPDAFADPFLKKAQLAMHLITGTISKTIMREIPSSLTAFADYQLPRVLRALGVLRYSSALADKVDSGQEIPALSDTECCIRASTLLAVEKMSQVSGLTAAQLDQSLWNSQDVAGKARFHLTDTTHY